MRLLGVPSSCPFQQFPFCRALSDLRETYKDAFLKKHGVKFGFMSAFLKASSVALKDVAEVNASIEGNEIIYHDYVDISVAVATPKGLVTPVLRGVEKMNYLQIEKELAALGAKVGILSSLTLNLASPRPLLATP